MSSDRAPVLVGVAQYVGRETDPTVAPDPVTMLADVASRAAYDSGVGLSLFAHVDTYLQIPLAYWNPVNGAALTAERLGIDRRARMQNTGGGGEMGVLAANHLAAEIMAGRTEGRRFLAVTPEYPDLLGDLLSDEAVGQLGDVRCDKATARCIFTPA